MEKQVYEEPTVELVEFDSEEIVTISQQKGPCSMQNVGEGFDGCFNL